MIKDKKKMSYQQLHIWELSNELVKEIHNMTLNDLPKYEMFETGSQIRRSIKSVKSNIVEGYGRRCYKQQYLYFLIIAQASNDETIDHLETLFITESLKNKEQYALLREKLVMLGKKINLFINAVRNDYNKT
jgi:four helix bundle protein